MSKANNSEIFPGRKLGHHQLPAREDPRTSSGMVCASGLQEKLSSQISPKKPHSSFSKGIAPPAAAWAALTAWVFSNTKEPPFKKKNPNNPKSINSVQTRAVPISAHPQAVPREAVHPDPGCLLEKGESRAGPSLQGGFQQLRKGDPRALSPPPRSARFPPLPGTWVFPSLLNAFPCNSCSLPTARSGDAKLPPFISANILHPPCCFSSSAF